MKRSLLQSPENTCDNHFLLLAWRYDVHLILLRLQLKHGINYIFKHKTEAGSCLSETTDLPGLHLLRAPSKGHVGVAGAGAVPPLLLDVGDERVGLTVFPLAAPVVKDLLDELVILLQEQLGLRKTHRLRHTDRSYS